MPRGLLAAIVMVLAASCGRGDASAGDSLPAGGGRPLPPVRAASPLGEGMGIQVQPWYLQPGDLARISAAGFHVLRWGIPWERVEQARGVYDWSAVDRFVATLAGSGLRSVVILGYGNRLYAPAGSARSPASANALVEAQAPATAEARAAFTRFAAAAALRYRDQPITWEIWNEPDNAAFWAPRPDPAAYAVLAAQTCAAIRAAAPHATVLGGAGAAMPNAVAEHEVNLYSALVHGRALRCLDGFSSHAYRMGFGYEQPDPESIADDNLASRTYLYSQLRIAPEKRFVTTEWGFTTANISPALQAAYLIRANLVNAATGVSLTIWYEWRDSRAAAADPESHFGILTTQGGAKNVVDALAVLSRISKAQFIRRLQTSHRDAYVFLLRQDTAYFLAAWRRTGDEHKRAKLYVDGRYRADISFMPTLIVVASPDKLSVRIDPAAPVD